jgi:hypothetical protein
MGSFKISSCSIADGPAIGNVNVSALWTDSTWAVIWPGKTREYVIAQSSRRMPYTLLSDRPHNRYEKVIDIRTGIVVGYARWTLPKLDGLNMESFWAEAIVPPVSADRERQAKAEHSTADFSYDHSLDELDRPLDEIMDRLESSKKYIG